MSSVNPPRVVTAPWIIRAGGARVWTLGAGLLVVAFVGNQVGLPVAVFDYLLTLGGTFAVLGVLIRR